MRMRRITASLSALALGAFGVPVTATGAEPPPVVSEDAADFTPMLEPDNRVGRPKTYALARSNGTVYAGGSFHHVKDTRNKVFTRHNLFAFNESTGGVRAFSPAVKGTVRALATRGSALYVGGSFTSIGGVPRSGLAKINVTTGKVVRRFDAGIARGSVNAIEWVNGRLLIGGTFSRGLMAVDPTTGRNTGYLNLRIRGTVSSSASVRTGVYNFSLNASRTRLVAVGNFTQVGGQSRRRAFALRLRAGGAVVDGWYYRPLNRRCASNNPAKSPYLTDVDFAPAGNWFVLVSTGFVPRFRSQIGTSVCDAAARFELGQKHQAAPTWINYTGGDTLYSVEVTPAAVYVQGHNRWLDNPRGRDSEGPGAVRRRGVGAINRLTGKALAWNPDKPAVQGGHAFLSTPAGLWVGSDSPYVGREYHRGLAFFESRTG